jgi:outer membrane protein TolC
MRRQVFPIPPHPDVSTGSESEYRNRLTAPPLTGPPAAESSARKLQPGAGVILIPPPPIAPIPPSMRTLAASDIETSAQPPLTLDALERMAVTLNPTLKQARAIVEANFGQAIQNGLWPNPTLSFSNSSWGHGGFAGTPQVFFTQDVITAGKFRLARGLYLEATKASQWNAMAVEYRVLNDIRRMFFQTLGWQAMVQVQKELVKTMEDEVITAREGYNMGVDNLEALHYANAALQDERLKYLRIQNTYRMYWQQLMANIGTQIPLTPLVGPLQGNTTPLEWDTALERLFQYSPELMATYADLRYDQINLKLQRVVPWPNIQIVGGAGYSFSNDTTVGIGQISLLGVPTWNWNQGAIRRADAEVLRQQGEIRRVQLTLQNLLATVYQAYLTAVQYVESYEKVNLPELRRAYELTLDSYEDDRVEWPHVLAAQRRYFEARRDYISYLVSWREGEVLIVGFLLSGALSPVPTGLPTGEVSASAPTPSNASTFVSPGTYLP